MHNKTPDRETIIFSFSYTVYIFSERRFKHFAFRAVYNSARVSAESHNAHLMEIIYCGRIGLVDSALDQSFGHGVESCCTRRNFSLGDFVYSTSELYAQIITFYYGLVYFLKLEI